MAKLADPCGRLAYATYLGGTVWDQGNGIAVDGQGHAYLTGYTQSANFPVTAGAFQTTYGGGPYPVDAFAAKLFTGDSPATGNSPPTTAARTLAGIDPSALRFPLYLPAVYRPIGSRC